MHLPDLVPFPSHPATSGARGEQYRRVITAVQLLLEDEPDWVAAMSTVASVLKHSFLYMQWVGFYCSDPQRPGQLVVGPYQGSLGCLRIDFARGVCGAAARTQESQLVPDVHAFPGHIACASTTQSELVVPVLAPSSGSTMAVLDCDSDTPAAFDAEDQHHLERLAAWLADKYHRGA